MMFMWLLVSSAEAACEAPDSPQCSDEEPAASEPDTDFLPISRVCRKTSKLPSWRLRGRFINVGLPRWFKNGRGKVWKMELIDSRAKKGRIECTLFNEAIDKFDSIIKAHQIFKVSKGIIKKANKNFNKGSHNYEIHLDVNSKVNWEAEDDRKIPQEPVAEVVKISQLSTITNWSLVSVCGVLVDWSGNKQYRHYV